MLTRQCLQTTVPTPTQDAQGGRGGASPAATFRLRSRKDSCSALKPELTASV